MSRLIRIVEVMGLPIGIKKESENSLFLMLSKTYSPIPKPLPVLGR